MCVCIYIHRKLISDMDDYPLPIFNFNFNFRFHSESYPQSMFEPSALKPELRKALIINNAGSRSTHRSSLHHGALPFVQCEKRV